MEYLNMQQTDIIENRGKVLNIINRADRFLLTAHVRPDGDAVGALSGLAKSLCKYGKNVRIALADKVPPRFSFVFDDDERFLSPDQIEDLYDVILVLDSGDLPRTGLATKIDAMNVVVVNIDHHASNNEFGEINLVDAQASSTCEMIVFLLLAGKLPLDADIAKGLYLGLLTDTRFFQNESLRSTAFRAAEALLDTGLDTIPILGKLNGSRSLEELKVLGMGLSKLALDCAGQLATVVISQEDLTNCGGSFQQVWSCGIFGQMTSLEGVTAGVGIIEGEDGKVYCEFRSRNGFNVKDIAVAMGGGGHLAASGCNKEMPLAEVVSEAIDRLRMQLDGMGGV